MCFGKLNCLKCHAKKKNYALRIRTFVPEYVAQLVRSLHYLAGQVNVAARFNHQIAGAVDFRFELCLTERERGRRGERERMKERQNKKSLKCRAHTDKALVFVMIIIIIMLMITPGLSCLLDGLSVLCPRVPYPLPAFPSACPPACLPVTLLHRRVSLLCWR